MKDYLWMPLVLVKKSKFSSHSKAALLIPLALESDVFPHLAADQDLEMGK